MHGDMQPGYETFEHGADMGVRGGGRTPEEAFVNAARALFSLMVVNLEDVKPEKRVEVSAEADTLEELLLDWLNNLLSASGIENLIFSAFGCRIQERYRLSGWAAGERIDPERHELGEEVKGATYSLLKVYKEGDLWVAQCVVDV